MLSVSGSFSTEVEEIQGEVFEAACCTFLLLNLLVAFFKHRLFEELDELPHILDAQNSLLADFHHSQDHRVDGLSPCRRNKSRIRFARPLGVL